MKNTLCGDRRFALSRRDALRSVSAGFGFLAFAGIASQHATADDRKSPLVPKDPHFKPRAKRVIFLCMRGGPSHLDTFDYKPLLHRDHGENSKYPGTKLHASPWSFKQRGKSGLWISELFPEVAKHADELCLLRGMHCDQPSHAQAFIQMHTGSFQFVRPSMGAWSLYGLGTVNQNLPGFISINPPTDNGGATNYGSSFLPAAFQGTKFQVTDSSQRNRRIDRLRRGEANPYGINNLSNSSFNRSTQAAQLELIKSLNLEAIEQREHAPMIEGTIESYELAFRMQQAVPETMDLSQETQTTLDAYGIGQAPTDGFGRQCLLARRFAEAGVRFIELGHGSWDQHANIQTALGDNAAETDKPIAALINDLKQRDMLKETLIIWGGEFGRTPHSVDGSGRDHNHKGYTTWMCGGGAKSGFSHGATDDHGYEAIQGKVHIHDWHATILHLLGLDHEKLVYQYGGRDMRLTDVAGEVAHEVIA